MRSKSRAKRSNTELNPLIGDFINTIGHSATSTDVRYTAAFGGTADISPASYPLGHPRSR
jgi:hypothetical protein